LEYSVSATDLSSITLGENDTVKSVLQNLACIMATPKGSVPLYREFGLDLSPILDRPQNVAQPMTCANVKEAVETYEPRAKYKGTTFAADASDPGKMSPTVKVSIGES